MISVTRRVQIDFSPFACAVPHDLPSTHSSTKIPGGARRDMPFFFFRRRVLLCGRISVDQRRDERMNFKSSI